MSTGISPAVRWTAFACAAALGSLSATGCTRTRAAIDPCALVPVAEAQSLDATIEKVQRMPPDPREKNELCLYFDDAGERRLMVFYWPDRAKDVAAHVRGSLGADGSVVDVPRVGDAAAAGYRGGELRLFAAANARGMIGVRARDAIREGDPAFGALTAMVERALHRL